MGHNGKLRASVSMRASMRAGAGVMYRACMVVMIVMKEE